MEATPVKNFTYQILWNHHWNFWQYSTNRGRNWTRLHSDNPEDPESALIEAIRATGVGRKHWRVATW